MKNYSIRQLRKDLKKVSQKGSMFGHNKTTEIIGLVGATGMVGNLVNQRRLLYEVQKKINKLEEKFKNCGIKFTKIKERTRIALFNWNHNNISKRLNNLEDALMRIKNVNVNFGVTVRNTALAGSLVGLNLIKYNNYIRKYDSYNTRIEKIQDKLNEICKISNSFGSSTKFNKSNNDLISLLLHSQQQAHIFHLASRSYAQHKALEEYYTKIQNLLDSYAEAFQGGHSLLKGYKSYPISNNVKQVVPYFEKLLKKINQVKIPPQDAYLNNILDTIYELIYQTLYKLKYLK